MYLWWRIWHDDERRVWAERQTSGDPAEAKKNHARDKDFAWASGLRVASVSPLEFSDDKTSTMYVAAGWARDTEADRPYHGRGADQVSTQVKAEVQPAEPGSSPGGSTELPF